LSSAIWTFFFNEKLSINNNTNTDDNVTNKVNTNLDNTSTTNYTTELLMNNDEANQKWIDTNSTSSSKGSISTFPEFGIRKGDRQSDSDDDEEINTNDNSGITLLSAPIILVEKTVDVTKDILFTNPMKYFFG